MTSPTLAERHCRRDARLLEADEITTLAGALHEDWAVDTEARQLRRSFRFRDYYQTIAFVNALAWVAHREDHHPDLEVGYNRCTVRYSTHSVGGLSENDFICAVRIDLLATGL